MADIKCHMRRTSKSETMTNNKSATTNSYIRPKTTATNSYTRSKTTVANSYTQNSDTTATHLYAHPKTMQIRVRLRKPNFANHLMYYHAQSIIDPTYLRLKKIVDTHKATSIITDEKFIAHINTEGFFFKSDKVKCKDINGRQCLINDILDRDVSMKLIVKCYDFVAKGNRLVGVSLAATEICAKSDLDNYVI